MADVDLGWGTRAPEVSPEEWGRITAKWRAAARATEARLDAVPRTYRRAVRYVPRQMYPHHNVHLPGGGLRLSFRAPGGAIVTAEGASWREAYLRAARAARLIWRRVP